MDIILLLDKHELSFIIIGGHFYDLGIEMLPRISYRQFLLLWINASIWFWQERTIISYEDVWTLALFFNASSFDIFSRDFNTIPLIVA
jgi:hypothetical protein